MPSNGGAPAGLAFEILPQIARHAALRDTGNLVRVLQSVDSALAPELARTLRYHHLATLVVVTIDETGVRHELDSALVQAIERARAHQPSAEALLQTFDQMQRALHGAGVEAVLLKGLYLAERLYGGYHRRPQYDLDVLVRARHRSATRRVLNQLGYTQQAYDLHSRTFTRDEAKVDVHGWLRWAPAYRVDERAVWQGVRRVRLDPVEVLILSDEFNLVLLGLSCFEDLAQGMAKLKQLLDVFLFLRQVDASMDWDAFFARRATERTDGILAHVFALVVLLFDARDDVPRLCSVFAGRRDRVAATRALALTLVSAPRKHPANLSWFGRVYPGSLWHYLAWFWLAGFPQNLQGLQPGRLLATIAAARRR